MLAQCIDLRHARLERFHWTSDGNVTTVTLATACQWWRGPRWLAGRHQAYEDCVSAASSSTMKSLGLESLGGICIGRPLLWGLVCQARCVPGRM